MTRKPHADADPAVAAEGTGDAATHGARRQQGVALSPGVGVGRALVYRRHRQASAEETPMAGLVDPATERMRLRQALAAAASELRALAQRTAAQIGAAEAGIFDSQALMLEDPTITERASELIEHEGSTAAAALTRAAHEQADLLAAMPGPLWQTRAADVRDAAAQALRHLRPRSVEEPTLDELIAPAGGAPVVVVAEDLAPSETAQVRAGPVAAIVLAHGSMTAHAAILARALHIPTVGGLGPTVLDIVADGETLLVNGSRGFIVLRPTPEELTRAEEASRRQSVVAASARGRATAWRARRGQTSDGLAIEVLANVGSMAEAAAAAEVGAEGIGLLRTEFLFAQRATLPDEAEQAELYAAIIGAFGKTSGAITIRTLDAGADKPLPALSVLTGVLPPEANPALGMRGLRVQLAYPELLATQMRGILLAAARTGARVRVLLPMVATVSELRQARAQLLAAQEQLARRGIALGQAPTLGVMVETPAAVLGIEALASEAAFLSIGTNDLAQYVMAADRLNPRLGDLSHPLQPPVLQAIAAVARAGAEHERSVGVCGEMAGVPALALLLTGLGVRELSMSPAAIPEVKERLAAHSSEALRSLAARVFQATTLGEARHALDHELSTMASDSVNQ